MKSIKETTPERDPYLHAELRQHITWEDDGIRTISDRLKSNIEQTGFEDQFSFVEKNSNVMQLLRSMISMSHGLRVRNFILIFDV